MTFKEDAELCGLTYYIFKKFENSLQQNIIKACAENNLSLIIRIMAFFNSIALSPMTEYDKEIIGKILNLLQKEKSDD